MEKSLKTDAPYRGRCSMLKHRSLAPSNLHILNTQNVESKDETKKGNTQPWLLPFIVVKKSFYDIWVQNNTYGSSAVNCTGSPVKAGSKCSKSLSDLTTGLYGGGICFPSSCFQVMERKNGCDCISANPVCG